jgi:probable rRNA maturation factor
VNSKIQFFPEGTSFILKSKNEIRSWLIRAIEEEKKKPWYINFIFCNDSYLLELNKLYLGHAYLTDILTFPFSEHPEIISGDIYISIERVEENAKRFGEPRELELRRVMIHGVLHLIGYKDKTPSEKKVMREMEDYYLKLFKSAK